VKNTKVSSISLPSFVWIKIDEDRKDISRSKFVFRLIQTAYKEGSK